MSRFRSIPVYLEVEKALVVMVDSSACACELVDEVVTEAEVDDDALPFPRLRAGSEAVLSIKCDVELAKEADEADAILGRSDCA